MALNVMFHLPVSLIWKSPKNLLEDAEFINEDRHNSISFICNQFANCFLIFNDLKLRLWVDYFQWHITVMLIATESKKKYSSFIFYNSYK